MQTLILLRGGIDLVEEEVCVAEQGKLVMAFEIYGDTFSGVAGGILEKFSSRQESIAKKTSIQSILHTRATGSPWKHHYEIS